MCKLTLFDSAITPFRNSHVQEDSQHTPQFSGHLDVVGCGRVCDANLLSDSRDCYGQPSHDALASASWRVPKLAAASAERLLPVLEGGDFVCTHWGSVAAALMSAVCRFVQAFLYFLAALNGEKGALAIAVLALLSCVHQGPL